MCVCVGGQWVSQLAEDRGCQEIPGVPAEFRQPFTPAASSHGLEKAKSPCYSWQIPTSF